MAEPLIRYTGHPLVDVGAATLAAMAEREDPEQLTMADLDRAADELLRLYQTDAYRGYLSVLFPNSAYVNPTMAREKREAFFETYLRAYKRSDDIGARCVFTGGPAQVRVYRQHLPLITGEGLFNFAPQGDVGLPVGGAALLCIQAMPLGSLRSQGRALVVHSDRNILTFEYASDFLQLNRDIEARALLGAAGPSPRSAVLQRLPEIQQRSERRARYGAGEGVTVYHLTNYGTSANVDIYALPAFMVDFVRDVHGLPAWRRLVQHYWQPPAKKGEAPSRNFLYERVFDLPDNAQSFVSEFLLGRPRFAGGKAGPRATWELVDIFLREVLDMSQTRIDAIRAVAENLAEYIARTRDASLFARIFLGRTFSDFMFVLVRANARNAEKGLPEVMTFDQCLQAFALAEDLARPDWRLARDLMLLRMMEAPAMRELLKEKTLQDQLGENLSTDSQGGSEPESESESEPNH